MKDIVVIQRLQQRGFDFSNVEEMLRYEAVERQPRHLDAAPKRISLQRADNVQDFGCKQQFVMLYNQIMDETNGDVFQLDLGRLTRFVDKDVYVLLKTLIVNGVSYIEELSMACADLFILISKSEFDTITKARVYDLLQPLKSTGYYDKQILEAVKTCLFSSDPIALYWSHIANYTGLYRQALDSGCAYVVKNCATEKDVDKFVAENYKAAKADKQWFKNMYTDGVSKALIAAMYFLKEENPDVLIPDTGKGW